MKLVEERSSQYGLSACLSAIGLPKSTWYYWKKQKVAYEEKYGHLREPLLEVVREHPGYGYRRVIPELQERGYPVGELVVRKLLGCWHLSLVRSIRKPRLSAPRQYLQGKHRGWNLVKDLEDPEPFQVWYTDFTEIWYAGGRKKAYFMPILDHKTKWIAGWAVSKRKNTFLALDALDMTRENLNEVGINLQDRFLHHDQDSVYTGYRWLQAVLIRERARLSFSENGAKGNTVMESFFGRFKVENESLFHDAANIWELMRVISRQVDYYNRSRRHSTLGNVPPLSYMNQKEVLPNPAFDLAIISA